MVFILGRAMPRELEKLLDWLVGYYESLLEDAISKRDRREVEELAEDFVMDVIGRMSKYITEGEYNKLQSMRDSVVSSLKDRLQEFLERGETRERFLLGFYSIGGPLVDAIMKLADAIGMKYEPPAVRI